jgi:YVTN family beta-propeller protein
VPTLIRTFAARIAITLTPLVIAGCAATTPSNQTAAPPPAGVPGSVWVANEAGESLTIFNAKDNTTTTTLIGISGPHNVQAAPNGTVWATSDQGLAIDVNPRTYQVTSTVSVGSHPAHVVVTPNGRQAWVTNYGDDSIAIINTKTGTGQGSLKVGDGPHGMRFSPDGRTAYAALLDAGKLAIIDTDTLKVRHVDVGPQPVQVAPTLDGDFVYVTLAGKNAVAKVDTQRKRVTAEILVPSSPAQALVTPDGRWLLVANQGTEEEPGNTVSRIDLTTDQITDTLQTGSGPHGLTTDPDARFAYVTNMYDDTMSVIDLAEFSISRTIPTGKTPNGITYVSSPTLSKPGDTVPLTIENEGNPDPHEAHHP